MFNFLYTKIQNVFLNEMELFHSENLNAQNGVSQREENIPRAVGKSAVQYGKELCF